MRLEKALEMLANKQTMESILRFGIPEFPQMGRAGEVFVGDAHHRVLAAAIYQTYLSHGGADRLSPESPGFYAAMRAWAARWIAGPLDANSIPTGDALDNSGKSYSNGQLHRAVEKYYDKILTWLGNASVRVPVEIDSKGNPKLVESYHRETDPYLNRVSSAFQYVRDLRHLLTIDGSGNAFPQRRIVFSPQIIRPAQTFFDTNRYFLEEFLQNVPVPVDSPR